MKRQERAAAPSALSFLLWATVLAGCAAQPGPSAIPSTIESTDFFGPKLDPTAIASTDNLALGRPVTASASLPGQPPEAAVDGDVETRWISGSHPQQWIEIDPGAAFDVEKLVLVPAQDPAGATVHRVFGGLQSGEAQLLYIFRGETSDGTPLEVSPIGSWGSVRYLRIETTESPSWVAWREIAVFGRPSSQPLAQVSCTIDLGRSMRFT